MKRLGALLLVAALLLSGCAAAPSEPAKPSYSTRPVTTHKPTDLIEASLKDILTQSVLTQTLGREMKEPTVLEGGTQLTCQSTQSEEEMPVLLTVNLDDKSRDMFDHFISHAMNPEMTSVELGDVAYWSATASVLDVYAKNHMIEVNLTCIDRDAETLKSQAMALATAIINAL